MQKTEGTSRYFYNFTSIDETTRYSHGGKYFYRFQVKLT